MKLPKAFLPLQTPAFLGGATTALLVSITGALVAVLAVVFLRSGPPTPTSPTFAERSEALPLNLLVSVQPGLGVSARPLSPAPVLTVQSAEGKPVAGVAVSVGLRDGSLAEGSTLEVMTDDEGRAVFDNLRLARAGGYYLVFSAPGCASVSSAQFVVRFGPPRFLVVLREPLDGSAGSPVAGEPAVRVTDEAGNPVPDVNVEVTSEEGVIAGGRTTVPTDAQGMAVFSDLVIPQAGADYRLKFNARAAGVEDALSSPFSLTNRS
jgi:5-hydroxyisourate hydrolase-like protein (transthyretin family)